MKAGFTCVPNCTYDSELWLFSGVYDRRSALIDLMGMARFQDATVEVGNEKLEVKKG